MMTGRELYKLLQSQSPSHFWAVWDVLPLESRKAYDIVAGILNERQAERVATEVAGDDI